ncbi:MAG: hypothetical protein A3F67_04535 [Verrucomicrobia bacterium RIFCSPHIGHO2_12_FULL_41_10]|nr:MAG: hypothetical protein A3F67_04535 [Verrucomicrobia bacterium RIFCSPHIGHO2_12_FULL_41_10]HLB32663.1 DUF167 domain-containing protein [Chthoniobacterales bacterium]
MSTLLSFRVTPGARHESLKYLADGSWKISLREKAIDGQANLALCKKLAAWLDISRSQVTIQRGEGSRQKFVKIAQLEPEKIKCRLLECIN